VVVALKGHPVVGVVGISISPEAPAALMGSVLGTLYVQFIIPKIATPVVVPTKTLPFATVGVVKVIPVPK
jgi:hypothetical protein